MLLEYNYNNCCFKSINWNNSCDSKYIYIKDYTDGQNPRGHFVLARLLATETMCWFKYMHREEYIVTKEVEFFIELIRNFV